MATLTSSAIKSYSLLAQSSLQVRASASDSGKIIRNVTAGMTVGIPSGKIIFYNTTEIWIEVIQVPFSNGFVKLSNIKILSPQKTELFLYITPSTNSFKITFSQNLSENQALTEIDQLLLHDQTIFSSVGRSLAMLKQINTNTLLSNYEKNLNDLILRYNSRQKKIIGLKGFQASMANHKMIDIIPTLPVTPTYFNGLGAIPAILLVPVVKWSLVGITALSIWFIVKAQKTEGLSDLKLSKDVENILAQKLSEEDKKRVLDEFEKQRNKAFSEGKKNAAGTVGQLANLLMWGAIGIGVTILATKVFKKKSQP